VVVWKHNTCTAWNPCALRWTSPSPQHVLANCYICQPYRHTTFTEANPTEASESALSMHHWINYSHLFLSYLTFLGAWELWRRSPVHTHWRWFSSESGNRTLEKAPFDSLPNVCTKITCALEQSFIVTFVISQCYFRAFTWHQFFSPVPHFCASRQRHLTKLGANG
jgi:hypothetical protein